MRSLLEKAEAGLRSGFFFSWRWLKLGAFKGSAI
jgi:hypothetical protein